jgi:hypothetical protein
MRLTGGFFSVGDGASARRHRPNFAFSSRDHHERCTGHLIFITSNMVVGVRIDADGFTIWAAAARPVLEFSLYDPSARAAFSALVKA